MTPSHFQLTICICIHGVYPLADRLAVSCANSLQLIIKSLIQMRANVIHKLRKERMRHDLSTDL